MENSYYISRKVVRTNTSKVHSISVKVVKHKVYVISKVREYVILVICKSKLTKLSSVSNPILVVVSCNKLILSKFKAVKFTSK